jgi:hypothetical protein
VRALGLTVAALALVPVVACTRDEVGDCVDISPGDVVITEFRGSQTGEETSLIWVELFNTTSRSVDLESLKVRYRTIDGDTDIPVLIRRSLPLAASGYVVLGLVPDDELPPSIDYGFSGDFHQGYLAAAAVDLIACDTLIDRARYDNLPKAGTYSFGGTPTADNNDDPTMWCTNPTSEGTPKMANPPCP